MIVRYARQAVADFEEARAYIASERPGAAEGTARHIRDAIEGLRQFPERGRPGRVHGTRELVVPRTPFVVPYRIAGQEIQVLAVLHGTRAWPPPTGESHPGEATSGHLAAQQSMTARLLGATCTGVGYNEAGGWIFTFGDN